MITPSFSSTATERVLPKLALDFTTASLDPRVTFTRTTDATHPATYVNSSGVVTAATNNQPRFDYSPQTLACKGLLIEESRTNTFTYSEDFSAASWTRSGINAFGSGSIINATTAPDGTLTGDYIQLTGTDGNLYTGVSGVTGAVTQSVFAKAETATSLYILYASTAVKAVFNLATGVVTSQANGTASIQDVGNGWYRCTFTPTTTTSSRSYIGCTGVAGQGVYIWGAQLEAGAFPTSYIPTTTTALTRNADLASMTGTNFSDWYNQSEGSFAVKASFKSITSFGNGICSINIGSFTDSIYISRNVVGYGNATVDYIVRVGGAITQADYITNIVTSTDTPYQICVAYKNSNFAISSQGANTKTKSTGAIPTVDQLYFGRTVSTFNFLNGWIQEVNYWPQRLVNPEVQAFSKQG